MGQEKESDGQRCVNQPVAQHVRAVLCRYLGNIQIKTDQQSQKGTQLNSRNVRGHQNQHSGSFVFWHILLKHGNLQHPSHFSAPASSDFFCLSSLLTRASPIAKNAHMNGAVIGTFRLTAAWTL